MGVYTEHYRVHSISVREEDGIKLRRPSARQTERMGGRLNCRKTACYGQTGAGESSLSAVSTGSRLNKDSTLRQANKMLHYILTCQLQGDQKVSANLMITTQKVASKVHSFPCQSPDIYWH
jgi:hypothetical protein